MRSSSAAPSGADSWARAAYLPTNVVLASVAIKDGLIALHGPDGQERRDRRVVGFMAAEPFNAHLRSVLPRQN